MIVRAALAAAVLLALPLAAHAGDDDPLAPARAGKYLCTLPDAGLKMCGAISHFVFNADGSIDNDVVFMLKPDDATVMQTSSPVVVRDGKLCGFIRQQDFDNGQLLAGGKPIAADLAARIHAGIDQAMQAAFGGTSCTTFVPDGDGFKTNVDFNGTPIPGRSKHVIWIDPREGYTVAGTPPA